VALCARALLPFHEKPKVEQAVRNAISFLRESRRKTEEKGDPFSVMDYTVWSKPSLILFLADAIETGMVDPEDWEPTMRALVMELRSKQKSGGGWSYYQGGEIGRLDPNLDVSFSFVTAFVLVALRRAEEVGVKIPDEMKEEAISCLERMRNKDSSFEYTLVHANEKAARVPLPAGSAGRGPLCAFALKLWGRATTDDICSALDRFLEHRHTYRKEHGKTLMHCGLEGQGSHYLMFDYAFAAAACAELEGEECGRYQGVILNQILEARTSEGSYLDNPILGDHYGTGMALWAFSKLLKQREER
jgi:hypothetical protein